MSRCTNIDLLSQFVPPSREGDIPYSNYIPPQRTWYCLFGTAKKLIQTPTVGAGAGPALVFGSSQCPTRPNLLQMGEEVHLKGVRRASPLPLWRLARRLVQKQCSHLQLDLLPSRGMAGMDLQGNTNRIDKRSRPPTVKYFSSFPRSLPSPPPSSYISLYSHLHLRSNALL
jgi:hypothetical protein